MELIYIISLICSAASVVMLVWLFIKSKNSGTEEVEETGGDDELAKIKQSIDLLKQQYETTGNLLANQQSTLNETVVKSISALGDNLRGSLSEQQKAANEKLARLETELERIRTGTLDSLEKVRNANAESMEKLRTENRQSLDKINDTVNEKLQKTLNDRLTQSFSAVNERLEQVHKGLGEMKTVASGVTDLKNVLSNVKTRGILGEIQLGAILEEILSPEQYSAQQTVKEGSTEKVDYAVKLPGANDGEFIYLPIDAKFPQDRFSDLLAAYDSGDPDLVKQKRSALDAEIKRCAKSIHDKYIVPPYTTDFAIMFLPFEGLYAEVINMGLVELLQSQYKVNIAGPSTMAAMLSSLRMGFRTLAIQKKSGEVWKILEAAKKEFDKFGEVLDSARNRLRQADDELEKLIGTRTKAISRSLRSVELLSDSADSTDLLDE